MPCNWKFWCCGSDAKKTKKMTYQELTDLFPNASFIPITVSAPSKEKAYDDLNNLYFLKSNARLLSSNAADGCFPPPLNKTYPALSSAARAFWGCVDDVSRPHAHAFILVLPQQIERNCISLPESHQQIVCAIPISPQKINSSGQLAQGEKDQYSVLYNTSYQPVTHSTDYDPSSATSSLSLPP